MDDDRIVALYWSRSEAAITETAAKYGSYLRSISFSILGSREDAQECVNDTYHDAWNAMPPHRPSVLSAFLGKITRRISIDRWRKRNAEKRGGGELPLALEELEECVSGSGSVEDAVQRKELEQLLDRFLDALPVTERRVFLRRYWYLDSVQSIARQFGFSRSKTASMLFRCRNKLQKFLQQEGLC